MVKVEVVPVDDWHIDYVAARLRDEDRAEVAALSIVSPVAELVRLAMSSTWCRTGLIDGWPCQVFGVTPIAMLGRVGAPWLLGTDEITRNPRPFLRHSIEWRDRMLLTYPTLRNVVHAENATAIRWLSWLGFRMSDVTELPTGALVRVFEIDRRDDPCA